MFEKLPALLTAEFFPPPTQIWYVIQIIDPKLLLSFKLSCLFTLVLVCLLRFLFFWTHTHKKPAAVAYFFFSYTSYHTISFILYQLPLLLAFDRYLDIVHSSFYHSAWNSLILKFAKVRLGLERLRLTGEHRMSNRGHGTHTYTV